LLGLAPIHCLFDADAGKVAAQTLFHQIADKGRVVHHQYVDLAHCSLLLDGASITVRPDRQKHELARMVESQGAAGTLRPCSGAAIVRQDTAFGWAAGHEASTTAYFGMTHFPSRPVWFSIFSSPTT